MNYIPRHDAPCPHVVGFQELRSQPRNSIRCEKLRSSILLFWVVLLTACVAAHGQNVGADFGQQPTLNSTVTPYCYGLGPDTTGISVGSYSLVTSQYTIQDQYGTWSPPQGLQVNQDDSCSFFGTIGLNAASGSEQFDEYLNLNYTNGSSIFTVMMEVYGAVSVGTATVVPKYVVLSILYDPPGDKSTSGFQNTQSNGATNTLSNNFTSSNSFSFSGGVGGFSGSVQVGYSSSSGASNSFTNTYQATSGSQLASPGNDIDHTQDQIFILIDPTFSFTQNGSGGGYFSIGQLDSSGNFTTSDPPDIVNASVSELRNPSTIPLPILKPQQVSPSVTLPGLASICANPLPVAQCTQQNACGCVASDFADIVAQDELANVTTQSTALNAIDPSRYVYMTDVWLEGPATTGGGTVSNSFSLTDGNQSCQTYTSGTSYDAGVTVGWQWTSGFTIGVKDTHSFKIDHSASTGNCNGTSHAGMMTTGSDVAQCAQYVDVYEDTVYHTFAYALPTAPQGPYPSVCGFTHQ